MTKTELLEAIKNGESVWVVTNEPEILDFKKINKRDIHLEDGQLEIDTYYGELSSDIYQFEEVFKTKAEAEHYLHHANQTRTEQLPFLTWEEFKSEKELYFLKKSGYPMYLCILDTKLGEKIGLGGANGYFDLQQTWDLTEENFYKAYDECVKLFKGE